MKKVRFETPDKCFRQAMADSECHSPRPFVERQETSRPNMCYEYPRLLPYNPDPVERYENSNSSPYPIIPKTAVENVANHEIRWPSNDLELSMLDGSHFQPRQPILLHGQAFPKPSNMMSSDPQDQIKYNLPMNPTYPITKVLSSIENNMGPVTTKPTLNLPQGSNFFIKRDNLNKMQPGHINSIQNQLNRLSLPKENDPGAKKAELMRMGAGSQPFPQIQQKTLQSPVIPAPTIPDECRCHHCVKIIQNTHCNLPKHMTMNKHCQVMDNTVRMKQQCACSYQPKATCSCSCTNIIKPPLNNCNCQKTQVVDQPKNAVDKQAWMIEKYEQNQKHDGMELDKQKNVSKEKREPTVSDLFKIIKMQNEQLQLLQEKVDKFISASTSRAVNGPIQNYVTEQVALETVNKEQNKISIGVMTSFEMVRTSTVINKEIVTQTHENAQIQCNRSQISIKEVVSKTQPVTLNFLDGIMPAGRTGPDCAKDKSQRYNSCDVLQQTDKINDDKTLNELSLYNVQVDNATTPLISPEQSLYLDVRDYSDSDPDSDDQSNVGWTYYNKVMTHVNGVLQDSEMPSSASALFRNTKQQCVQMQIDKTNVSVTKRVKFGDDPLGIHQPHLYAASTDTSLKMNQLAAKYLKGGVLPQAPPIAVPIMTKPSAVPIEMSFATRNYMERHRILQGNTMPSRSPPAGEIPRFLDITALKQQSKLL